DPADGYTNDPADGYTNDPADGYTNDPADGYTDDPADGYTNDPADGYTNDPANGYTNDPADGYANDPADGYTNDPADGYTNDPADGYTNDPADGYVDADGYANEYSHPRPPPPPAVAATVAPAPRVTRNVTQDSILRPPCASPHKRCNVVMQDFILRYLLPHTAFRRDYHETTALCPPSHHSRHPGRAARRPSAIAGNSNILPARPWPPGRMIRCLCRDGMNEPSTHKREPAAIPKPRGVVWKMRQLHPSSSQRQQMPQRLAIAKKSMVCHPGVRWRVRRLCCPGGDRGFRGVCCFRRLRDMAVSDESLRRDFLNEPAERNRKGAADRRGSPNLRPCLLRHRALTHP
ncbi:MAG: hypothetical protein HUU23_16940, partial [Caldilineales bacterium]|nr:hypothetical protein [Caldilineales bacterium]